MASTILPVRNLNNKTSQYLERDVTSVKFSEQVTSTGLTKVILTDKERRYRTFGYVPKRGNPIATRNELALDYMAKFSFELNLNRVGRAPSKIGKD